VKRRKIEVLKTRATTPGEKAAASSKIVGPQLPGV